MKNESLRNIVAIVLIMISMIPLSFSVVFLFDLVRTVPSRGFELLGIRGTITDLLDMIVMLYMLIFPYVVFILIAHITGVAKISHKYIIINCGPYYVNIKKEQLLLKNILGLYFSKADDEQLITREEKRTYPKFVIAGFIACIILIIGSLIENDMYLEGTVPYIPFTLLIFLGMLSSFIRPTKYVIFDRLKGTITIYAPLFLPNKTIPFEKTITRQPLWSNMLAVVHPIFLTHVTIPKDDKLDWEFYVWYMDKNRPLPKGTLFDPYREKDFLRRKSEGFPPPIYESHYIISDDRIGYLYATDEFKTKAKTAKYSIPDAYNKVYFHIKTKEMREVGDRSIVLIGIWQGYYVFRLDVPPNPKMQVFDENKNLSGSYLVDMKAGKVSVVFI